jgi:chromosome segregation ATPase
MPRFENFLTLHLTGVVLSIMPPKKSWRAIANLSGGEKTLASLALVFALHVFKVGTKRQSLVNS